ncbi:MAG: KH domain-containing protein, partial [Clostridia bacterium]|nr:KH domain-containing protein [Clostridia bacterium]
MIKEARGFGDDIAEAQENALKNLGVSQDADVQYETISLSKKKILGLFGGSKAEVRAFIELPDQPQKKVKLPKKEKTKNSNKDSNKKPAAKKAAVKPEKVLPDVENLVAETDLPNDAKVKVSINYLRSVLEKMGAKELVFKATDSQDNAYIQIDGEDMGVAIGRRGETLDALQYLAGLAAMPFFQTNVYLFAFASIFVPSMNTVAMS